MRKISVEELKELLEKNTTSEPIDLSYTDLQGMDLSNKCLSDVNFMCANLTDTNLANSSFCRANMKGVFARRANFTGAEMCLVCGDEADFVEANFTHVSAYEASFVSTNFVRADFTDADFTLSNLTDAVLRDVKLSGTNLEFANLNTLTLKGADMRGNNLDRSIIPLSCGSLRWKIDRRLALQFLYHFCSHDCDDVEIMAVQNSLLTLANQFHRVGECPTLHEKTIEVKDDSKC